MAEKMSIEEKWKLITRNSSEIIGEDDLKEKVKSDSKISIYWGTAPTGKPHVGYMFPMLKVADLLRAGFHVKILLADLHAALDNTPWEVLEERYNYYAKVIPILVEAMGGDVSKLEFVKGSSFQLSNDYVYDIFKMSSITTNHDSLKAASEVVKMGDNPKVAGLIYPLMQALDEEYLGVDAQLGGTDQRKIMVLAREKLPQIGYKKRIEFILPLIPGLVGKKMSSSIAASKIELTDEPRDVEKKVKSADFIEGDIDNGVMVIMKRIIFTLKEDLGVKLLIERPEKFGGNLEYATYTDLEKDVVEKKIHPLDVKIALAREINQLLEPVLSHKKAIEKIADKAYPEN
jgi:tyrosyl-tRNA synthetase